MSRKVAHIMSILWPKFPRKTPVQNPKRRAITVVLDPDIYSELADKARSQNRTVTAEATEAIKQYVRHKSE